MILAAAYLRVSTDEQVEQGISLPAQKSRILAYCRAQGWELYDYYVDDGYSGKDLKRPAMQKLIGDAKNKKFNTVIVIKLDRLSRRQKDVLYLLEDILEPNQIGFSSVTETFETTTPFGKAGIGMMAVFAQLERETIIERVRGAKKEAAEQGRFGGGGVPYGFDYNLKKKKLEIVEDKAEVVRRIYDMYLSGKYGFQTLANELNAKHIAAPVASQWHRDIIKKILTNPYYAGYVHRKGDIHPGQHDAIVPLDKWDTAQKYVLERFIPRPAKDLDNLLIGLIYCGECGARMRFKTQNTPDTKNPTKGVVWTNKYYICYSRAKEPSMRKAANCSLEFNRASFVNQSVIDKLNDLSLNPDLLQELTDKALSARNSSNSGSLRELQQVTKELESVKRKIERWNTAFENEAIELDELSRRTKELREKRLALEARVVDIGNAIQEETEYNVTAAEVIENLKQFPLLWSYATPEERRAIIYNLVKRVNVYQNHRVEVLLNL